MTKGNLEIDNMRREYEEVVGELVQARLRVAELEQLLEQKNNILNLSKIISEIGEDNE